ncbi:bifunctional UDP-3-O-[3-hydroxymyristoyl] N-acetylglucosamine deacetylase/3-hydroxyacyl-ACP dehydratase [Flavobacteriales bacterium]|jgi:UDP-3-O-[3-hydroxymyristoyl] N-acetylglucosamine deacetylase / 3-hydroxyacyl-[acyl-carrier-protein] dehydratase|nr:bifunctional UDP-3-O-[3-hydroxymyristoyl] N-acetylglucosamine deacetylase/3-hydroxyacyl-ACP dehydratase [Flavobacteriales bacterium]
MGEKQRTISKEVSLSDIGLHTGKKVNLTFCPVKENYGIKFQRTDLEGQPIIEADVDYVTDIQRGTTLTKNGNSVSTIEHSLAALTGLGIDNCLIKIDSQEVPIMDGSSKPFIEILKKAGIKELDADKNYFVITEPIKFSLEEKGIELLAIPDDHYNITSMIDYESPVLGKQFAALDKIEDFEDEIASSRTFCFLHELEFLAKHNLIKGGDLSNAIVVVDKVIEEERLNEIAKILNKPSVEVKEEGILDNIELRHANEPARHKLLDIIGDLTLVGRPIKGKIIASKPGHGPNTEFAKLIKKSIKKMEKKFDVSNIALDIEGIKKILPHRPPFLMVDRIIELTPERVVGVKNVSINEDLFRGHFPNQPIFPGVLQVEAMAQVGGVLVLSQFEDPENYLTYFMKMDNVKFRKMVVPGDTLVFELTYLSPYRRGIAHMLGKAYVNGELVTEAEMMAKIDKVK